MKLLAIKKTILALILLIQALPSAAREVEKRQKVSLYSHIRLLIPSSDFNFIKNHLEAGKADANENNEDGHSLLLQAVYHGNEDVVRLLLTHGALVDHKKNFGKTALSIAFEKKKLNVAELLLKYGADVHEGYYNRSLLEFVCDQAAFFMCSDTHPYYDCYSEEFAYLLSNRG